jgi:hypothetical protein
MPISQKTINSEELSLKAPKIMFVTHENVSLYLHHFLHEQPNSQLVSLDVYNSFSKAEADSYFRANISTSMQFATDETLSLFYAQEKCAKNIAEYESIHDEAFDYILNTRENLYYFQPLDISKLLAGNPTNSYSFSPIPSTQTPPCQLYVKDCLQSSGINVKWELFPRLIGDSILKKLHFLKESLLPGSQVNPRSNPLNGLTNLETFEKELAKGFGLTVCEFSSNMIPVISFQKWLYTSNTHQVTAQHKHSQQFREKTFCFNPKDLEERCYPTDTQVAFLKDHSCVE